MSNEIISMSSGNCFYFCVNPHIFWVDNFFLYFIPPLTRNSSKLNNFFSSIFFFVLITNSKRFILINNLTNFGLILYGLSEKIMYFILIHLFSALIFKKKFLVQNNLFWRE